jgi:adenosine deaminase
VIPAGTAAGDAAAASIRRMRDLVTLPKVHLHVHLEGSMRPSTVVELARRHGVELPAGLREGRYGYRDFTHFIAEWVAGLRSLQRPEDVRRIAYEFCEDQAADGVRYAEVSFSLPEHAARSGDWDGPVLAVLEGFADGRRDFGIECRPYVDVVRGVGMELSRMAMEAAVRHRGDGIFAIGLGGDEKHPAADYAHLFRYAADRGLRSIPHAGETAGPASIRSALDDLGADRIGHGIRCLEDEGLVERLRDERVPLDVCPTSNAMTRVVPSIREHPLPRLLGAGLRVTLNADDPSMFRAPLSGEFELARRVFGMRDDDLAALVRTAVEASFADERTKALLHGEVDAWLTT